MSVWDDGRGPAFAPLAGDVAADVCVVGLGASGLCAAIETAALGRSVVGLDAGVVAGAAAGCNGGILRAGLSRFHHEAVAAFGRERAAMLYRLTAAEIDRAASETPETIRQTGSLRVAVDDEEWADCERQLAALRADGGLETLIPSLRGQVCTTRLQMLATEPDAAVQIPCPVSLNHGFDYGQQLPDGRIALGGGRNRSFDTEWGAPAEPSPAIQGYLDTLLRERIGSRARVTRRWAARVAYTTSGLPVLGEVERGVWVAGGYNGTGNLMGALCGRAAAQLAVGAPSREAMALAALLAGARGQAGGADAATGGSAC